MTLDAGFTGEILQEGYGKEAVVQLHPINGYVRGTIYQVGLAGGCGALALYRTTLRGMEGRNMGVLSAEEEDSGNVPSASVA